MKHPIFLSASIPLPHRDPKYFQTADTIAIRDSIRALVSVVIPKWQLIFGGHPAITPLIRQLTSEAGCVVVYQSSFFEREFPKEVADVINLRIIPAVNVSGELKSR